MLSPRRRRDLVRDIGSDAGISLVELLVTMVLMTVVSGLAFTWLIGENATDTKTQNTTFTTSAGRTVLTAWSALIRTADVPSNGYASLGVSGSPTPIPTTAAPGSTSVGRFLAISPTSITFNADVANAPAATCAGSCVRGSTTQVTLSLTGGALTEQLVQRGVATKSITLVPSGAALAGNNPCLFSTYDTNGNAMSCTASTTLNAIARVTLAFTITPAQGGTPQSFQSSAAVTGTFGPIVAGSSTPAGA